MGTLARQQTTDNRQQTTDNRYQTTDNRQQNYCSSPLILKTIPFRFSFMRI